MTAIDDPNAAEPPTSLPLANVSVLDTSTILAGPLAAMVLGDFGADVVKVEHPRGDAMRHHGSEKDGKGLWWKMVNRNKRCVTLNLSKPDGREIFEMLAAEADIVIENFRPGVMERWGLGYERLSEVNPGLVMLRVTGFGQTGPYAGRAGFGTIAEAMSGFAHITGEPDGPPTLPPFGLADSIAGLAGVSAVMFALYHRDTGDGRGQMIDLSIIEPILTVLGNQVMAFDQLGEIAARMGNRSPNNAPRNTYRTRDGRWVAISTSANAVAERVMRLVGHPEVIDREWFRTGTGRAEHGDALDEMVAAWIGTRDYDDVSAAFAEAGAALAPIYDVSQVMDDPQYQALGSIAAVDDPELGAIRMQNVLFRMMNTPGQIRFTGKGLGEDNESVFADLGISDVRQRALRESGVI